MKKKLETGLIIVKEDFFSKIRRNLFKILFSKEDKMLNMLYEIEKPRNRPSGKIIIPKEIRTKGAWLKFYDILDYLTCSVFVRG